MKKVLSVLLLSFLLSFTWQQANAIITDPDDYIIFDTGGLVDSTTAAEFNVKFFGESPDPSNLVRFFKSANVTVSNQGNGMRGSYSTKDLLDMGFPKGMDAGTAKSQSKVYGIGIPQAANDEAAGIWYTLDAINYKKLQRAKDPILTDFRWDYNKIEGKYQRPSDSVIVRVPTTCDSIIFVALGAGGKYGLGVYELQKGRDAMHYIAGNNNMQVVRLGFAPSAAAAEGLDSVDYVVLGPNKDWFGRIGTPEFTSNSNGPSFTVYEGNPEVKDGLPGEYPKGERWGTWTGTSVWRIKIYGKIEKGEIPPFTGTMSGWTFQYRPKETGTVDLNDAISTTSGWGSKTYENYASDEGVIRSMLTASKSYNVGYDEDLHVFGARLTGLPVTSDTTDFTKSAQHPGAHFQVDYCATGYQDMTVKFNFTILKNGADSVVVVARNLSNSDWTVLGKVAKPADPNTTVAQAELAIPNDLANVKEVAIRIMQDGGDYAENAELIISGLRIDGYDDYVSLNDGAQKVAYITSAADRIHLLDRSTTADSIDYIYRSMRDNKDIDVDAITADVWSAWTADNIAEALKDYSVVVMSPFVAADATIVTTLGSLVGQKPILSLNAGAYTKWNTAASVANISTYTLTADNGMRLHPIFKDITLEDAEDGFALPKLLSGAEDSVLQAISAPESASGYVLGGAEGKACFFEDFTAPKYKVVFLGIKPAQAEFVNSTANKLIAQTMKYLTTKGAFAAPTFEIDNSGNAIVENVAELKDALVYDFSPLALSQSTILLKEGEYDVDGVKYGSGTFVLQPYQSGNVKIIGNMSSSDTININSITFKDMTLQGSASKPFFQVNTDRSKASIYVDNCTIIAPAALVAADADSATISAVSVKNSRLNNVAAGFISFGEKPMSVSSITLSENIINGLNGPDFIQIASPIYGDGTPSIDLSHNTVLAASQISNMVNMKVVPTYDSVRVVVSNNLFYNALKDNGFTMASDSVIRFKSEGNLYYNSAFTPKYTAQAVDSSFADVTMAGLGLTSIFESEDATTISKMSPLFTAGTSRTYIGAAASYSDRTEPMTIKVHNVQEFTDAMKIAIGGDVIEFYDKVPSSESDTLVYISGDQQYGVYHLGTGGFAFPTTGGDLTFRVAEGQHPVFFGRLSPNNSAKLDGLRIIGMHFADQADFADFSNENAGPFYFTSAANIGVFHVTQCTFENLQNQRLMRTNNCANLYIGEVRFDYNVFENHGGTMADGNVGAAHFFQFANGADYTLDRFTFVENIVSNFHGSQLFNIARSGSKGDSAIVINISNNLFYKLGGNAKDQNRNFLEFNKAPMGCTVDIQIANNLFFKRWSDVNKPICQVALYNPEGVASSNIVITNNYFEG
ncbi:MAG: hypothetical protein IJR64_06720, partial [Bacteroidales bacterium]|nr:hypothetical protein [Bacteroidales bacterium]